MQQKRVAVVMNGGISLAVWMGGVTHELNRLRLASTGIEPEDEAESAVHAAWVQILEAAGTSVVVDTIAGTSAGGLNGTLLATAIAQGTDLSGLKNIWLDKASLESGKLLRSNPDGADSLLDGKYFTDEINDVLATVSAVDAEAPPYPQQEVTLLVTATAIGSSAAALALEGGRVDTYRDSRRVFEFRRRIGSDEAILEDHFRVPSVPRTGQPSGPLARAARASASYPAAFAPVPEDLALREHRVAGSPSVGRAPLMDGGVLDNAPFGPLVTALEQRAVDAPFERVILYVVPSAGARQRASLGERDVPDVVKVLSALIPTIRESDQRLDVDLLSQAFQQMSYQRTTTHAVLAAVLKREALGDGQEIDLMGSAQALFDTYRHGRAEAFERWLVGLGEPTNLTRPVSVNTDPDDVPVLPGSLEPGSPWRWGSSTAERVLRWLGRSLVELSQDGALAGLDSALLQNAFLVLARSQRRISEIGSDVEASVAAKVAGIDGYDGRLEVFCHVLAELTGDPIGDALGETSDAIADWLASGSNQVSGSFVLSSSLRLEVLSSVFNWGGDEGDVPAFTYLQATPAARSLVELPQLTLGPTDVGYAEQNQAWASTKLYGERWGHFGAFATPGGRAHDWLWGRLDGASALAEMVLGADADPTLVDDLVSAILTAESTSIEAVVEGAAKVESLTDRELYDEMMSTDGEDHRELLLATIPEVLGRSAAISRSRQRVAKGLTVLAEGLLDFAEVKAATKDSLHGLVRRAWKRFF